jgi:hypothetical protein
MNLTWRTVSRAQAVKRLYPELQGRAFHITSVHNFLAIVRTGVIMHNRDGNLQGNGGYNAYFKNRGCVSFCDLHGNTKAKDVREAALSKYNIFGQGDGDQFVYLFLASEHHGKLLPWHGWKAEEAWSEMVVPHLEAGYPGFVPLEEIEEAMLIQLSTTGEERGIRARMLAAMQAAERKRERRAV